MRASTWPKPRPASPWEISNSAQQAASEAADLAAGQGSRLVMVEAKQQEAWDWDRLGKFDKATAEFAEVRDLSLKSGNPRAAVRALNGFATVLYDKGDFEGARKAYEEALTIARQIGAQQFVATVSSNIGNIFYERGKLEEARHYYQQALDIDRTLGSPRRSERSRQPCECNGRHGRSFRARLECNNSPWKPSEVREIGGARLQRSATWQYSRSNKVNLRRPLHDSKRIWPFTGKPAIEKGVALR